MIKLIKCAQKVVGKLVSKADLDAIVQRTRGLEEEGRTPVQAEREAVQEALNGAIQRGEDTLAQIRAQRPDAHAQAQAFWEKETIRTRTTPPPLPAFVTEAGRAAPPEARPPEVPPPFYEAPAAVARPAGVPPPIPEAAEAPSPPPIPEAAAPISDAAQEVVNGLPGEQRNAAQKGFARDDRDPYADGQRSRGEPVSERKSKPVTPEKNTKLVADASRYGLFDKSTSEVLKNIASDPKQPRWKRLLTDLLIQLGLGQDVDIRMVNTPDAVWPALYVFNHRTGRAEVLINVSHKGDLVGRLLHELVHHGTLLKLRANESELTPTEVAAKRELQKMYDFVRDRPEFRNPDGTRLYGTTALEEFVSEIFSSEELRAKLDEIKYGKTSVWQQIKVAIMHLLMGDRGMRAGSMLEAAIGEAIKVAGGVTAVEQSDSVAAMQERRARAARLVNAFPNFQEEIANITAPMADNMGISDNDLIERKLDHESAFYAEDERAAVEKAVDERAGGINATSAEIDDVKKRIEDEVKYYRAYHPAKEGWANKAIKVLGLEDKKGLTRGDPTKQNPSGIAFKIKYKDTPYTYARENQTAEEAAAGESGKPIQRFLKQGKPDKETGKPIDNPEWGKRMGQLANKMFDDLQEIMARRGKGDEKARVAQVIVDQIEWYRSMRTRLRTEFGSMSDYVADVIAGFSPITDVPGNWNNFIDYFRHVMKGDYDEAFRKFDEYISADPENRSSGTYKKEFPPEKFPQLWPRKLQKEGQPLFGANTGNALTAGLDLWRAIKSGTAPKARNFGLNLIGQSLKATIDRWAGRYLQRMHASTWRIPPSIEGAVTGKHMPGENVELVSGDFGMGQDVFEQVAKRLQESGHEIFKDVTAADLQAILWFAEKEVWEMRKWTDIMGAGSSMNVVAQATAAQRYEAGTAPGKISAKDEKLMGETIELRTNLNAEAHMLGAKMVPSVNIANGKESKTFDGEWVTEPEYDPDNSVGHVAKVAARVGKKAAHISRVIVNEYETNPEMTPGLHIFFKGRVGDAEIKGVLAKLKEAGITNGISLTVDPRVRPEVIKSLDPKTGANQYNGVRVQFVPQYDEAANKLTRDQIDRAFVSANNALANDASIAEARVIYYDTLVMERGVDYDSSGKLTKTFSDNRKRAWVERARSEGAAAAARRDNVQKAIADRKRQDLELESRMEREREERIATYAEFQRRQQAGIDPANDGGIDRPTVAAMQYEDQQEPVRDPHGGRTSLVRAMVNALTGASRDREGIEVPKSEQEVRGAAGFGSSEDQGRKGSAPLWRNLGATFRKREASLYSQVDSAAKLIQAANPEDPENPKDPARYQNSQALLDYLSGKETPADPELKAEITELRKEIPVIPQAQFKGLDHLDSGAEADVYHDPNSGVVYKFYPIKNGMLEGSYVPGQIRLDRGGGIRIGMGERPTVTDVLSRMERANSHGTITPHELTAITPEGQLVFASPFVEGREVTQKNLPAALARAGVHFLSDLGATSGIAKLPDGRWVVYDDLHPGNVRTMPGGRVEIIDASNRELDSYEVSDLTELGKMPPEKPPGPPKERKRKLVQKYDNAIVVAPMVETHHGTPHEWEPEKKIRLTDGTVKWVPMDTPESPGEAIVDYAPAGRVRAEKVGSGEGNAAFGWGVLYSAQRKGLAEGYREQLSYGEGKWLLDGQDVGDASPKIINHDDWENLRRVLKSTDPDLPIDQTINDFREEAIHRETLARHKKTSDPWGSKKHSADAQDYNAMADVLEKFKDRLEYNKGGAGNVYTLQLDVDDPELLDWFMPMKDQMWVFDKVAEKLGTTREGALKANEENEMLAEYSNHLESEVRRLERTIPRDENQEARVALEHERAEKRWEEHYKQPVTKLGTIIHRVENPSGFGARPYDGEMFYDAMTDLMKSARVASEYLNSAGVPGIVFLDRESRKKTGWTVIRPDGQVHTVFSDRTTAEQFIEGSEPGWRVEKPQTTNNYVMFDPEKIKVVAKNGEVVRTVADDMPAPVDPKYEPVSVAAMAEEDVKDDRDLTVSPMAGAGRRTRKDVSVENYKPAGWTAPFKRLSWEIGKFEQQKRQMQAATVYRVQTMVKDFERTVKKVYKGKPSPQENKNIMLALGNLDNRLTQEQAREAMKRTGAEREKFQHEAHMENVARFKEQQEEALNSLPDEIREAVNVLRETLDLESGEALKDTGLDTELRARLDANQGVFLHSNAFQHFEDDVWGNDIRKSDDPEAKRIRGAAENLFRNEIIAENAAAYQDEHKDVSDEDALRLAGLSGDLDQQIATRLDDYLKKEADEPSRLHMLMGKMPVTRTDAGKMVSLDRENIPKEIRELWGQYDDPATNFAKTLSVLANHNAQTRMQNAMLDDGLKKGYFWQQGVSPGPRPQGLVQMTRDTRGPMVGVHGPPALKEGLSLMNQRPVRSLMSEMNSVPLMMKTVGSIGSAVRNFFGNPLFMVSNGNLLISAIYWPKAFWLSLQRAADFMVASTPEGRKQLARMIELGVLDESVDAGILEKIAKNARTAHKWENQKGFGASVAAMQRAFVKGATIATRVTEVVATPFKKIYTMADNFWRLANYNAELLRQKWINPDLSLEQQEEAAAEITRRTLPTYSNIIEPFRESYGKLSEVAAPYLSFQAEAIRTYASTWALAGRELASGKPKEQLSGVVRLVGLTLATSAPIALGMASKAMFGYDDDDEKAIRAGLPEYQRNNMLFFLPRGPNGEPRYLDLNFVNPYSLVHKAVTAAWRGKEATGGAEAAAWSLAEPFLSPMPIPQFIADIGSNRDLKRGGAPIWDEYASPTEKAFSILQRIGREGMPGTLDSAIKIGEAYTGKVSEKTGKARDLREEVMKVFPGTAITTFDRDKAMQAHVGEYKKAARNASGLFDKKMSADGPIGDKEVTATYKEADERSYRAFQEMHKAYLGLLKLKMKPEDAIKQMLIGFGDEIRKGGLSNTALAQILSGNYQQFMPSKALLEATAVHHPERVVEFGDAQRQQSRSRTASP